MESYNLLAKDIADYFLYKNAMEDESDDFISDLKIQKLVYYAQGFSLALLNEPLFDEEIEAWMHGPVVPELYQEFKKYGNGPIDAPKKLDFKKYPEDVRKLLDEVYLTYGQFTAWKLRNLTHEEPPWKNAPPQGIITHDELKKYFKTLVK